MPVREIVKDSDLLLRKKSEPVRQFDNELWTLLDDMNETMTKQDGVGLAGPQVGVLKRVAVINVGEGLIELVNPIIIGKSGKQEEIEGCLSCPGKYGITKRPKRVIVMARDRHGNEIKLKGKDLLARAFCHEIDHLDGKLFYDDVVRMVDVDAKQEDKKN